MKKLLSVILAVIMITMSVFSVGYVASAEESGIYYVGETWFSYRIEDDIFVGPSWGLGTIFDNYTTLYITNFSDDFSRKVTIPDEIDGVKIENVVIEDYECIETLVLSDGIKTFACFDDQGDLDHYNEKNQEPNSIKYLYLGKEFHEKGMIYCQYFSESFCTRLKQLREIYVSEDNKTLASKDGILYSKDFKKVIMVPEKNKYIDNYSSLFSVYMASEADEVGQFAYKFTRGYKKLDNPKLRRIGRYAFEYSKLRELTIRNKTTFIGPCSFSNCEELKTVTIKGNSEKVFGNSAFASCKKLKKVVIDSKKIPEFNKGTFSGTKKGIKFYVKNKKLAKELKNALKKTGVDNAKIYVGRKLICTKK